MILVTGGAGVLGSRLVQRLVAKGRSVRVLTLPGDPNLGRLDGIGCEVVFGDVAEAETLKDAFAGVDTVYHLAAVIIARDPAVYDRVNVGGTRNMAEASVRTGVRHFIFVSSASVVDPASSAYARSKWEAERIVSSRLGPASTIVRPTLIYEREGGQEFMLFLDSLRKFPVVPFIGRGRGRKNPVDAEDIVRGLAAVEGNPRTRGRVYNLSGGETVTIRELARLTLRQLGLRKPILTIPLPVCRAAAFLMERTMADPPLTRYAISRIVADADLDNGPARRDLGYDPIGIRAGLAKYFPRPSSGP
jgi:nucleoside-diphosphate-sugar epimerase